MPRSYSWMPCAAQGVKGFDDDDEVSQYTDTERAKCTARVSCLYERMESADCPP